MTNECTIYIESNEIIIHPEIIIDSFGNEYTIYNWENADVAIINYNDLTDNKSLNLT